jgi:hypothetical protein
MGMIGTFVAVAPSRLVQLIAEPDTVIGFLFPDEDVEPPNSLDVDKAWQGLHFLLTGHPWEGDPPLALAVLGGTDLETEDDEITIRYLTPDQVRRVADALRVTPRSQLEVNFHPAALKAADIYPSLGTRPEDQEYVLSYYDELVTFYNAAADRGDGVVKAVG